MFRFRKTLDTITLFHKPSSPASTKVVTLLKQVSANSTSTATEDQASDHSAQSQARREEFQLDITEDPPTLDQLQTILQYVGKSGIPSVVDGATSESEALKRFKVDSGSFKRPVVVDWNNGKAHAGSNESEILKMLDALPKK